MKSWELENSPWQQSGHTGHFGTGRQTVTKRPKRGRLKAFLLAVDGGQVVVVACISRS